MDWFRNLKIGSKLLSAFGVVVGLTLVLGVVASTRLLDIQREDAARRGGSPGR